ncbi:hypothetical protein [Croceitalea dokdonensis]|nr:hypothetical protein [Croceitalea dokdonensis]
MFSGEETMSEALNERMMEFGDRVAAEVDKPSNRNPRKNQHRKDSIDRVD